MNEDTKTPEIDYPIDFPLKVIGADEDNFELFAIEIVRRHVPELLEENITHHLSETGKYLSVSFQFIAQNREQVDALYAELSSHKRVLMIL